MAGHEFSEPADRKRKPLADSVSADLRAVEQTRLACDPAFRHGVVVGFDGSTSSERALAYAIGMARRSGSGLIIVHVANRLPTTVWAGCEPRSSWTSRTTAPRCSGWNSPAPII